MELKGKVAVITGGARGMGKLFATDLAKEGVAVSVCDLDSTLLESFNNEIKTANLAIETYKIDVSSEKEVESFYNKVASKHNGIDISINNAGITRDSLLIKKTGEGEIKKFPFKNWQSVINVNLTGVFLSTREAAYQMVKYNKKGVIISLSSISRQGNIGQTNYTATKAAVSAMTVTWAKELSRYGIRVAAIAPGYISTEMTDVIPDKLKDKISATIPLKRFGTKREISDTVKFIIKNDYITGRTLEIDGGLRL